MYLNVLKTKFSRSSLHSLSVQKYHEKEDNQKIVQQQRHAKKDPQTIHHQQKQIFWSGKQSKHVMAQYGMAQTGKLFYQKGIRKYGDVFWYTLCAGLH